MDEAALVDRLRAAGCVFAEEEAAELRRVGRERGLGEMALATLVRRREVGEPLEHVLGQARFAGHDVCVEPGVFVPRRRSELLVEEAVRRLGPGVREDAGPLTVELCCGSGALTRALLARVPGLRAWAGDVDPGAVRCAAATLAGLDGVLGVAVSDLDAAVPRSLAGRVDALVAHVPYVPTGALPTLPREARDHEPRRALDGGPDGLDVLRAVAARAPRWLRPGGVLLAELAPSQVAAGETVCRAARLVPAIVRDADRPGDEARGGLVLAGLRPAS